MVGIRKQEERGGTNRQHLHPLVHNTADFNGSAETETLMKLLGIDEGTTGTRAVASDEKGKSRFVGDSRAHAIRFAADRLG